MRKRDRAEGRNEGRMRRGLLYDDEVKTITHHDGFFCLSPPSHLLLRMTMRDLGARGGWQRWPPWKMSQR